MAAQSFRRNSNYEQQIKALEKIILDYEGSDYYSRAVDELFDAYIDNSISLAGQTRYAEALDQFLKIFSLDYEDPGKNLTDYDKRLIFFNMPSIQLKTEADRLYFAGNYNEAFYLYNIIADYHPEMEESISKNMVESRISIINKSGYGEITPPERGQRLQDQEICILLIENITPFGLSIYLKGDEYKIIRLEPQTQLEIEIQPGEYIEAAELSNGETNFYLGTATYEPGRKYIKIYEIVQEESVPEES